MNSALAIADPGPGRDAQALSELRLNVYPIQRTARTPTTRRHGPTWCGHPGRPGLRPDPCPEPLAGGGRDHPGARPDQPGDRRARCLAVHSRPGFGSGVLARSNCEDQQKVMDKLEGIALSEAPFELCTPLPIFSAK